MSGGMSVDGVAPAWFDPQDERTARAAWSRLAEPGDEEAWSLVAQEGAVPALEAVIHGRRAGRPVAGRWRVRLPQTDPRRDLVALQRVRGRLLIPSDPEWPLGLDGLGEKRPFCLWVRGGLSLAQACERSIAVVGARAATYYGERQAGEIAAGVADHGLTVVSGAAYGVDAAAHRAALAAGLPTVAVLACGIDRAYPRGNERLIEWIADEGCLVSEVPPGSSPTRWRFLERNRMIAAMTRGTVVVEAAWRSGALGTAYRAMDLGRPVGAVPGPVTAAMSAGCHRLLRQGATCVTDAGEAVELVSAIGEHHPAEPVAARADHDGLSAVDLRVLDALPLVRAAALPSVAVTAGLEPSDVEAAVGRLEVQGLAERSGRGWRRSRRPDDRQPAERR